MKDYFQTMDQHDFPKQEFQTGRSRKRQAFTSRWRCFLLLVVAIPGMFHTETVSASGREISMREYDLDITLDTRWAGGSQGGYYPIRIRVVNRGKSRILTFRFESGSDYEAMPTVVRRDMAADQNATLQFTLSVPLVSSGADGVLHVEENGKPLKKLSQHIRLPQLDVNALPRPALLVISPNQVDCSRFDVAVQGLVSDGGSAGPGGMMGGFPGGGSHSTGSDYQVISPTLLPDSWINYTPVDLVAVSLETLDKLQREKRSAILKWVDCGGTLLIYNVGSPAARSKSLSGLLGLDESSSAGRDWQPADPALRNALQVMGAEVDGEALLQRGFEAVIQGVASGKDPIESLAEELQSGLLPNASSGQQEVEWPAEPETFNQRTRMLGLVIAFKGDPFPGSARDWNWLLDSVEPDRFVWTIRNGISARKNSQDFREFLIPNVQGVPVYAFLALMTMFTIIIGPLNYFVLRRRKQLYMLVLTIPVIACFTSLSLFAYSIVAHGFGVKSRVRSLTLLDQGNNTAVTTSRLALFAGMAPSGGLRFSPDTAVFPFWPLSGKFESGVVDWTEEQSLASGWLRSRTRTQFVTVSHRPERQRLEVGSPQNNQLTVSNGFEWKMQALIVAGRNGSLFFGKDLPAGGSLRLERAEKGDLREVANLLGRHPLEAPERTGNNPFDFQFDRRMSSYYNQPFYEIGYQTSLMERTLDRVKDKLLLGEKLPRNSYIAIFQENPNVELGIDNTDEQIGFHVLIGYY